jgi:hypothetical protein
VLRGSQDTRGFASSGWRKEHDCAVASTFATDRLQCGYIDVCPSKFREHIGNGTGAVVAVNEKRCTFAQPELGLLCGGDKNRAVFGDKFELRSPWSVLIAPECDEVHARVAQRSENAGSFADLVGNRRRLVFHHANLFCHDALLHFCHDALLP